MSKTDGTAADTLSIQKQVKNIIKIRYTSAMVLLVLKFVASKQLFIYVFRNSRRAVQQPLMEEWKIKRHRKDRSVAIIHLPIHRYTMYMYIYISVYVDVQFSCIEKYWEYTLHRKEVSPLLHFY